MKKNITLFLSSYEIWIRIYREGGCFEDIIFVQQKLPTFKELYRFIDCYIDHSLLQEWKENTKDKDDLDKGVSVFFYELYNKQKETITCKRKTDEFYFSPIQLETHLPSFRIRKIVGERK
jgi:hypothetical protein